jgi:MtrB/PioB family decaheme-associated outer membrane protein
MNMRTTLWTMVAALLLIPAGARAQDQTGTTGSPAKTSAPAPTEPSNIPDIRTSNVIDFGVRATSFGANSDEARFQRYRDLRNGGTLDLFRFAKQTDAYKFNAQADHVGYRDQRYTASYNNYGNVKTSFEWNQIPLFFSRDTSTLFTTSAPGVLLLPDSIQTGLQNKTTTLASVVTQASVFDLRLKRSIADFKATYSATNHLDLNVAVKHTTKTGNQPWAGTFAVSNNSVELAVPLDTRTTELGAAAEWASDRGSMRIGYDGSFFRNNIGTLVWDNPMRVTDSPTAGPVQGRESLWPNSDMNAGTISGLLNLPARSRATAYISIGNWSQNDPLIPFTINSALPPIALDRPTADVQARVTSMAYTFNSRPTSMLWLNARFRSYDFDNRTPVFHVTNTVNTDTSVAASDGTSPYAYTRRTFDADASLTPVAHAAFRVGYTREGIEQTFRSFDTTTEDTLRLSADATGMNWLSLRAVYEHGKRVGSGLDEQTLDDIGEQVSLRQFDISDRNSDRFSAIVQVIPVSQLSFNATASVGKEDRPGAAFGLRSNDNHAYSVGVDYVPLDKVSLGVEYEHETFTSLQASRQANPGVQFNDPTRDWTTDADDTANTFTASLDLLKVIKRTDVRVAYNFSHAQSTYVYGLGPNSTLVPPVQLPPVVNEFQRGTLDLRHYLTTHVAAGLVYWYDKYSVNDFALGQATLTTIAQPSILMLGYLYRPYTANTVSVRFTYLW